MTEIEPGVVLRASEALTAGQETFTAAQVAVLLHLAFQSGDRGGYERGYDAALGQVFEGVRYAFGGPKTDTNKTMKDAVNSHIRAADQRQKRREADQAAHLPQPQRLVLNAPDWPPVTAPGADRSAHNSTRRVA